MINRLLIRIKVAQLTYACLQSEERMYADEKLMEAVEASQMLHNFLLALIVKVTDYRKEQIESARNKWLPTEADLNPNTRFIDNRVARLIRESSEVVQDCMDKGLTSDFDTELFRTLFEGIEQTQAYQDYMSQSEEPTFAQDKALWVEILSTVFAQCEKLDEIMEDRNIFWNDDLSTVLQTTTRTIKSLKPALELITDTKAFKNDEDRKYAIDLFHYSLDEYYENVRLINEAAPNWEANRMAMMDKVIMSCALSEIKHMDDIPTAISINEYVELSKFYCSADSSRFINGVIDRIANDWRKNKVIIKH